MSSYVERTRKAAKNPISNEAYSQFISAQRSLTRSFLGGEIDLEKYKEESEKLGEAPSSIELPYPGPLYGLLRSAVKADQETAKKLTYHTRDHYDVARREGVYKNISICFVSEKDQDQEHEGLRIGKIEVSTNFYIPKDVASDEARRIVREVITAPSSLSEDDLARLPEYDDHC
jgi:hypothetical protein